MKRWMPLVAVLACSLLAPAWASANRSETPVVPDATRPATAVNRMHPRFAVLDEAGLPVRQSGRPASSERTCGACHDAEYINAHSGHWNERVKASCVACHWEGGQLPTHPDAAEPDGKLRREVIRVSSPQDANCASCHGIVHAGEAPVAVPADFEAPVGAGRDYGFTLHTGAVFSPQDVGSSYLNLEGKATRTYPWDVHARRLVRCVDCHFAANNPTRKDLKQTHLDFLVQDPRRIPLSEFLHRPDHRLVAATCRTCHDPTKTHEFLPYRQRHLDALECQACHIPHPMAPTAQMIDETVVRPDGAPAIVYRGLDREAGDPLNVAFSRGYRPLLLLHRNAAGERKIGPFNAVDRWFWASARTDRAVPIETMRQAYLESGHYATVVVTAFDTNHDGLINASELRLDTPAKRDLVAARLVTLGVVDPVIRHAVTLYPLQHGVLSGTHVQRDCNNCHAQDSQLGATLPLATYTPGTGTDTVSAVVAGAEPGDGLHLVTAAAGSRIEARLPGGSRLYVFGNSHRSWANRLGFAAFLAVLLGTMIHGGLRMFSRKPRAAHDVPRQRVYLYRVYERLWHWLMAISIIALMLTGLQVEFAGARSIMPLPLAVMVHNFFAIVLTANAFLSLFYHLTAGAIRQFIPQREGLARQVAEQARYYATGILLGQPQPSPKTAKRKLNPLQQLTYLVLLNVLFPLQVVTGTLIWGASRWPQVAATVGGLTLVAPLHALGSWLFLAFFVLHLYLTTTGHTVFSHVRAMIDGHEELEISSSAPAGGPHA